MKKSRWILFGVLISVIALLGIPIASVAAATTATVVVTQTPAFIGISNSASTFDLGGTGAKVNPNTTYYSNPLGYTTSPTVGGALDAECEWTLTNTSTIVTDLTVLMSDYSGGDDNSTNSNDGTNGATTFGAKSYFSGQASGAWVVMKDAASSVGLASLAATTDIKWGFLQLTQSGAWTGANAATSTITVTATIHT